MEARIPKAMVLGAAKDTRTRLRSPRVYEA